MQISKSVQLFYSTYDIKIRNDEIWDIIRKKWVKCTPEEWVRQHFLHYLITDCGYPAAWISVEKQIKVNGMQRRTDIVLYDRKALPRVIVECKAESVMLNNTTFRQAANYNLTLQVPYLIITNGAYAISARIDHTEGQFEMLEGLPEEIMLKA
jgi:predicted type IV restriction endonuclease